MFSQSIVILKPETLMRSGKRIVPSELEQETVKQGLAVWDTLRGERRYPSRSAVTPRALAKLLPKTVLLQVDPDKSEFVFRIVGDIWQEAHGFNLQGKSMADIDRVSPGYGSGIKRIFARVCRKREPVAMHGALERDEQYGPMLRYESLYLPLGETDSVVDHILGFGAFTQAPPSCETPPNIVGTVKL